LEEKADGEAGCTILYIANEEELVRQTAQAIADGKVVGWFQGRMELEPRALGNRSILADPRRAEMKTFEREDKAARVRRQNSEISAASPIDLLTEKIPG
jgi:predicted NodU family carbamoyl transferase